MEGSWKKKSRDTAPLKLHCEKLIKCRCEDTIWSRTVRVITQTICENKQFYYVQMVFVYWHKIVCIITKTIPLHFTSSHLHLRNSSRSDTAYEIAVRGVKIWYSLWNCSEESQDLIQLMKLHWGESRSDKAYEIAGRGVKIWYSLWNSSEGSQDLI